MSLFFRAAYLFGFKPWDNGVADAELVAFVEKNVPGKALDLGCGTGTNAVFLAQKGWDATGIDFVPRAIGAARTKAARAGVAPRLVVGDVTRMTELGIGRDYGLIVDKGCFHSIPDDMRDRYVREASEVARTAATFLLFGFVRGEGSSRVGPRGLARGEVKERFATAWDLVEETAADPLTGYAAAAWYTLHRR